MSNEFIDSNIFGNRIQSGLLILGMVLILALVGLLLGGPVGAGVAVALCVIVILFGPSVSPQILLRMYKAQPIPREASPHLHDLFHELVKRADLKTTPTLYYIPSRSLNAFATGTQSNSAVAITDGLLRILNGREVAGVLAHEISHIRHRDMRVLGVADTVSRIIATLSQIGQLMLLMAIPNFLMRGGLGLLVAALLLVFSPLISNLMQLALSRSREFNADLGAVRLTRDARGLASALAKLERVTSSTGSPWMIPGRKRAAAPAMLRTHPPTEERIKLIMEAGQSIGFEETVDSDQPGQPEQRRVAPGGYRRVRRGPSWHVAGLWY